MAEPVDPAAGWNGPWDSLCVICGHVSHGASLYEARALGAAHYEQSHPELWAEEQKGIIYLSANHD